MEKITLQTLRKMKKTGEKIVCLTAYDASFSHVLSTEGIEVILVGDSLGMVIQGHKSTLPVTPQHIAYHMECTARGNQNAFLISDMPFMSYATLPQALENAALFMRNGANMVKCEGGLWLKETIQQLILNGIPVCGHLGLTPQSVNVLGGYRVQGVTPAAAKKISEEAFALQEAGIEMLILECIPSMLASDITQSLQIPVIGIGAGPSCDGQILVLHDLLGVTPGYAPKFCKNFLIESREGVQGAVRLFIQAVKAGKFPAAQHSFV
ncbi:MAG: 3-methyl-2-oxobutanoate hydroxymethyltransferase [Gammaproteobacteria bacterium]|nr:3-methyl-2-oxobutanoate hydroxymethyltransferase [Gammaproteobacteria bacterium]